MTEDAKLVEEVIAAMGAAYVERIGQGDWTFSDLMLAALTAARPSIEAEAFRYAKHLAETLYAKHYADTTAWEPLGDTLGLLTQIDNMIVGIEEAARRKALEWRPIETVPKDGRVVELYRAPPDAATGIHWLSRVYAIWVQDDIGDVFVWPDETCVDVFDTRRRGWVANGDFFHSNGDDFTHWREPMPPPAPAALIPSQREGE